MTNAVTLNPATPDVSLSGVIDAAGDVGVFTITADGTSTPQTLYAALFGAAPTDVSILNTGLIESVSTTDFSTDFGIVLAHTGTIRNEGTIAGTNGGIALAGTGDSGYIDNTGTITGATFGIFTEGHGIISNFGGGAITSGGNTAIYLAGGGFVYNFGGTISGLFDGVFAGAAVTLKNAGLIEGAFPENSTGIFLREGGAVTNFQGGTITGETALYLDSGTVTNAGLISGTGGNTAGQNTGISITGTLTNQEGGTIEGGTGVALFNSGLIENAGLISGTSGISINDYNFATPGSTVTIINSGSIYGKYQAIFSQNTNEHGVTVINQAGGRITGGYGFFFFMNGSATFDNAGYVRGTGGAGIYLYGGINNSGIIIGHGIGVEFFTGSLVNSGLIEAQGSVTRSHEPDPTPSTYAAAIIAGVDSTVTNTSTGTISGSRIGLQLGDGGAAYNSGIMIGNTAVAMDGPGKYFPGQASNFYNYGKIAGKTFGILNAYGTVGIYNYASGRITGATGISAYAGQIQNAGTISASGTGIIITNGGTILDSGLIIGRAGTAISFTAGHANRLELTPTATITGGIDLNGALALEAGTRAGTLNAAELENVKTLTVAIGAAWDFTGNFTAAASTAFINSGTVIAAGALTLKDKLTGNGTIALTAAPLTLAAAAATQHIEFTGQAETLALTAPSAFNAKIDHFAPGDVIDLTTIPRSAILSERFNNGILTLTEATRTLTLTFADPKSFAHETFALTQDLTGTALTLSPAQPALAPTLPTFTPTSVLAITF
jgi:hypothetical protein